MSDANQTAPVDAREASMSRVTTLDTLLGPVSPDPAKEDSKPEGEESKVEEGQKPKKSVNERISQLVERKKSAEQEAAAAKREADEWKARFEALQTKAEPIQAGDKPQRDQFAGQDDYVEALADWKAKQTIAKREQEQVEAQAKAEFESVTKDWYQRIAVAKTEIDDFEDVVSASEIQISDVIGQALMRSEHGPEMVYYLAKHPEEARKVNRMNPIDGIRYVDRLASELMSDEPVKAKPEAKRSKAPEPIVPVKNSPTVAPGSAASFDDYRARRAAEKASRR